MKHLNRSVELHDSVLSAMTFDGDTAILHWSPLIIHASEGEPGRDPGVVWTQDATLTMRGVQIEQMPELPADVCEGIAVIAGVEHRNTLLIDTDMPALTLKGMACTGEMIAIHSVSGRLHLLGAPDHLEAFPQGSTGEDIVRRWRQEHNG